MVPFLGATLYSCCCLIGLDFGLNILVLFPSLVLSSTTGSLQCSSCWIASIPAWSASVRYQCSSSRDLPNFSLWSRHVTAEGASLATRLSAWEDRVHALCTCVQVPERQWTGLPRWQSPASDGRLVTSTSAVVFVVNAGRPGDTSCDIAVGDRSFPVTPSRTFTAAHTVGSIILCCAEDLSVFTFFLTPCHQQHVLLSDLVTCSCSAVRLHHVNLI